MELYQETLEVLNRPFGLTVNKMGEVITAPEFFDGQGSMLPITDYTNCPVVLPSEEISVGYTWSIETSNPLTEMMKINTTYTVNDISETEVILDVAMTMDALFGMEENTATGTYILDKKTGQFISGDRTMEMQMGGGTATFKIYRK
jgi:hypothetical protein